MAALIDSVIFRSGNFRRLDYSMSFPVQVKYQFSGRIFSCGEGFEGLPVKRFVVKQDFRLFQSRARIIAQVVGIVPQFVLEAF